MSSFLVDRIKNYEVVTGLKEPKEPDYTGFIGTDKAIRMINKHSKLNKLIEVHCDVDTDGCGTGKILHSFFIELGIINKTGFIINKEKDHGIAQKHVDYLNKVNVGLVIILDSSTNELELIKKLNCDVLVVDHHDIEHNELSGKTASGEYVIVSNMIDNKDVSGINDLIKKNNPGTNEIIKEYTMEETMSCGVVLYELLRVYQLVYRMHDILKDLMMYQWVGLTLFSDVILLDSARNQYYVDKTVHSVNTEKTLDIIKSQLNGYQKHLDKSFINYSISPTFNRAIRAGDTARTLDIILNNPKNIAELSVYRKKQQDILDTAMNDVVLGSHYAYKDITNYDIHKNYCGLLAGDICDTTRKNTIVFKEIDGTAVGSFRGRLSKIDYKKYFKNYDSSIYAQGHKPAFGFKVKRELLTGLLENIHNIEYSIDKRPYLTAGSNLQEEERGKYHIGDMDNFKRQGWLWQIAVANSKLSTEESIDIIALNSGIILKETRQSRDGGTTIYTYDILGLECTSFSMLETRYIKIYLEYCEDIKIYAENIRN